MAVSKPVGTHSTEDTTAGAKRRKGQNGQSVPVKKSAAKKPETKRATTAKKAAAAKKAVAARPKKAAATKAKAPAKKPAAKKPAAKKPVAPKPVAKPEAAKAEPAAPQPAPFLKARTAPVHALAQRASRNGVVFVFGNGDCGQLGLGEEMIERKKPFAVPALADVPVVDVASGGLHTMALGADGRLWSWGCNDQKALGRDGDEFTAALVQGLDGVRIA
ncbi:hypothetical protein H4R23_006709, partial [Coemansia sp. Cherry 401B]